MAKQTYSVCPGGFKNGLPLKYVRALSVGHSFFVLRKAFHFSARRHPNYLTVLAIPGIFFKLHSLLKGVLLWRCTSKFTQKERAIFPSINFHTMFFVVSFSISADSLRPPFLTSRSLARTLGFWFCWVATPKRLSAQIGKPVKTCFFGGGQMSCSFKLTRFSWVF